MLTVEGMEGLERRLLTAAVVGTPSITFANIIACTWNRIKSKLRLSILFEIIFRKVFIYFFHDKIRTTNKERYAEYN